MARDMWMTKRLAVKIDKIKKSLTVPAASYMCGFTRASIYVPVTISPIRTVSDVTLSAGAITIDFWAKFLQTAGVAAGVYLDAAALITTGGAFSIRLKLELSHTRVTIVTSAGTFNIDVNQPYHYEWHRFTITFSEVDGLCKFYVDRVLVGQVVALGNMSVNTFSFQFGQGVFVTQVVGFYNELALYNVVKTQEQIIQTNSYKGNVGEYGQGLQAYWKINRLNGTLSPPSVGVIDLISNFTQEVNTEEYAPIKFGASFVVAQAEFTLDSRCSLRFPSTPPAGTSGLFVIRWEDADGRIQRRKLWELEGVDLDEDVYSGEPIESSFALELWNVDGDDMTVIPEDIVFRLSKTTNPTTSYDVTPQEAATVTMDSTLAENFPIPLPASFNTQQVYTP